MYGSCLTARVKAKNRHGGIKRVILCGDAVAELLVDQRTISKSTSETAPVRYGMSGDYEVLEGENSQVVCEDGTRIAF